MITFAEFRKKYLGKQVEYHSFGTGALYQCVDLTNQYTKEVLGLTPVIGTNAADVPEKALKTEFTFIPNTSTGVPQEGDIVVWNNKVGGGYGHIAIFISGDANKFKSFDQNFSIVQRVTEETHTYANVRGWLRPVKVNTPVKELLPSNQLPLSFRKTKEFGQAKEIWGVKDTDAFDTTLEKGLKVTRDLQVALAEKEKKIVDLKSDHKIYTESLKEANRKAVEDLILENGKLLKEQEKASDENITNLILENSNYIKGIIKGHKEEVKELEDQITVLEEKAKEKENFIDPSKCDCTNVELPTEEGLNFLSKLLNFLKIWKK